MSKQLFEPISDKLICVPIEAPDMSEGGIILPDLENQKSIKAEVKYAGPGYYVGVDLFVDTTIKPGDVVLYQRFAAQTFEYGGVEYNIVQERDVITKINE